MYFWLLGIGRVGKGQREGLLWQKRVLEEAGYISTLILVMPFQVYVSKLNKLYT